MPVFDVVGVDLPTALAQKRIDAINNGRFPFETTDVVLTEAIARSRKTGNLRASSDPSEYENCDVVVIDVPLDVDFDPTLPVARFTEFLAAIRTLADRIPSDTLVLIETTIPPGTTEDEVIPELRKGLRNRHAPIP
jgi:UDP-N-acetyl-D-glucosamine dehydrogenase